MTNALIIFVLISVSLSASIISVASSSSYDMGYTSCSDEESFLVLWNIPISQCVRECHARNICAAVNYWKRSLGCELLNSDGGLKISPGSTGQPCVYARKADYQVGSVINTSGVSIPCPTCDQPYVCDLNTGSCLIKECSKLQIENAVILGNMLSVGAKVLIQCEESHSLVPPITPTSICQNDGTWSNEPKCIVDCQEPQTVDNADIYPGETLLDTIRYYVCQNGYTTPNLATAIMDVTCQLDATWTPVGFSCIRDCNDPPHVDNTDVDDGNTLHGTERHYTCDSGYSEVNNANMFVTCQQSDCNEPPSVINAALSPGTTVQGSERSYTCNAGYSDINNALMTVTCQQGGTWTTVAFDCVQDCIVPPSVDNAVVSNGAVVQGSERSYTCNTGYSEINNAPMTVTCTQGGAWTAVTFECVINCGNPKTVSHATVSTGGTLLGNVRTYTCDDGYAAGNTDNPTVTCRASGAWSAVQFSCTWDCGNPKTVSHATVSTGGTLQGNVRTYTCDDGYALGNTDNPTVTCRASGTCSAVQFSCTLEGCESGWHNIGDSCYLAASSQNIDVFSAMTYCSDRGSHLVEFETESECTAVTSYLQNNFGDQHHWWIGLSDVDQEGTWRWMSSGQVTTVTKWSTWSSEPDGGSGENYVLIWGSDLWADAGYYQNQHPLCEKNI